MTPTAPTRKGLSQRSQRTPGKRYRSLPWRLGESFLFHRARPQAHAYGQLDFPRVIVVLGLSWFQAGCGVGEMHAVPSEPFACERETWNAAKGNPHRYIAHAGGQIDGHRYTNSRQALDLAYENGFRLFELDLTKTSDGHLVASHDWEKWRSATGSTTTHPTLQQFKDLPLFETYQTLDLADLDRWFAEHTDSYLVTDKVTDFKGLLEGFAHEDRLIVEVFSVEDFHRAREEGVRYPMLSLQAALMNDGQDEVIDLLRGEPVKFVAVSTRYVRRKKELLAQMRDKRICVYAFTSNDPEYLKSSFENLIFGAYTDSWNVNVGGCTTGDCDTY